MKLRGKRAGGRVDALHNAQTSKGWLHRRCMGELSSIVGSNPTLPSQLCPEFHSLEFFGTVVFDSMDSYKTYRTPGGSTVAGFGVHLENEAGWPRVTSAVTNGPDPHGKAQQSSLLVLDGSEGMRRGSNPRSNARGSRQVHGKGEKLMLLRPIGSSRWRCVPLNSHHHPCFQKVVGSKPTPASQSLFLTMTGEFNG
jgi:hypothetical protein